MQKTLLLLLSIWSMTFAISAQTNKAEYGAVQSRIVGAAITNTGTVYSFSGGIDDGGDGYYYPDTLSLEGANNLVAQVGGPLEAQTTLDSWWSVTDGKYYQLEIASFSCDAGAEGLEIVTFPKDNPSQISKIDITDIGINFREPLSLSVLGDRFLIIENSRIITARFDSLLDTTIINLANPLDDHFPSRISTANNKIHVIDGVKLISINSNATISEVNFPEQILGLGTHGFTNPDVFAVTSRGAYRLIDGVVLDTAFFAENYSFESLVMNPHGRNFLCTYQENGGPLRYGLGSAAGSITSFTSVDPVNPGRFTEFISASTSAGGNARSVAVLHYENNNTSILMSTQNSVEFVDQEDIDVEITKAELSFVPDDPPPGGLYFVEPFIKNNSTDTIQTLQVHGEYFTGPCPIRNVETYTGLQILPGEEIKLARFNLSSPALKFVNGQITGRVYLTSANNFPLLQGTQQSVDLTPIFSSTKEAKTRTTNVYPNPAKTNVEVKLEAGERIQEVRAMDFRGKNQGSIPFSGSNLDVSTLVTGNYLLELRLFGEQVLYVNLMKE